MNGLDLLTPAVLGACLAGVVAAAWSVRRLLRERQAQALSERRTRAHLAAVMHAAMGHAIISTDALGRVVTFNCGAERMLGYRAADVVGHGIDVLHDPFELHDRLHDDGAIGAEKDLVLNAGCGRRRSWTYLRSDGTRVPVELTVSPVMDPDGTVTGHVAMALDVSDTLAQRRELESDERRWRILVERLPDTAVLLIDEDLRYRDVVADEVRWEELRRLPATRVGSLACPQVADQLLALYTEALHGGTVSAQLHGLPGRDVHVVSAVALPDHGGRREALVIVRDVTAQRRGDEAIAAAHGRMAQMFDASPFGAALIELDGTVGQANPVLEILLGRSDLVGKHLRDIVDVPEPDAVDDHIEGLLSSADGRLDTQWATRTRSGTTYLAVYSVLLRTPDGAPERILWQCTDESARHQHEQELTFLANHDPLTGLVNRRTFRAALRAHVDLCRRYGVDGAVLTIDLDGFKQVNDSLGHASGDAVLVDVAELLRERLRTTDVVARLGGDEFAVLLPRANRAGALEVAEHIRLLVRSTIATSDGRHPVSASIGVVLLDGGSPEQLMLRADRAMFDAKRSGRDRLVVAGE